MGSDNETTVLFPLSSSTAKGSWASDLKPTRFSLASSDVDSLRNKRSDASYGSFACNLQKVTPLTISWHNVTVKNMKSGGVILDNLSGMAKSGQFVALMGSSGAGKTTLLNTLLSRNLKNLQVLGSVLVDGVELGREITYVSGYVQQDELFTPNMTVREHLLTQARLRLVGYTIEQIFRRVDEIIKELGLRKCQNSRIGSGKKKGISGGEMRRLSFASELLSNPPLLFCDEPTTGLDSSMAESVVNVMAKLCKNGRTIICTIHQPSSSIYLKFDKVMFLAKGRLAYFGGPSEAVDLLARFGYPCPINYNPADMIIEKLSVVPYQEAECFERIQAICKNFNDSAEGKRFYAETSECQWSVIRLPEKRQTADYWVQTTTLLHRAVLDNWRNPAFARAKIMQKFIMGLFIGLLYLHTELTPVGVQNMTGALFYIVAELTYSTLFGVLAFLPQDYPLFVREYHDGLYAVLSYYVAKCLSYVPLFALDGWIMVSIAYWMVGFVPTVSNFAAVIGIAFLVEQSALSFGVMISAVCPSYILAISITGPIITVLSLTGGFFANIGELPVYISWSQYISWFRYGFESLAILQWTGAEAHSLTGYIGQQQQKAEDILKTFAFDAANLYFDVLAMVMLIIVFYAIGFGGLYLRVMSSR